MDRDTYDKYQRYPEPEARNRLTRLVTINPAHTGSSDFSKIQLDGIRCPECQQGLCSIQQTFGEAHISDMCSTFPRTLNLVDGVLERSLHLSCPEAARLALAAEESMTFEAVDSGEPGHRTSSYSVISTGNDQVNVIRQLLIELLQERSRPLWKRLVVVGYAVEELATHADAASALRVDSLRRLLVRFRQGEFDRMPASTLDDQALQIELVMELIVSRLGAEYTTPRFLQCYSEFIRGLNWTMESTMEDVIGQYRTSFLRFWSPFISRNEHSLENYLVNYAFRTLFPFGQKRADQKLAIDTAGTSMWDRYALLVTHYTIVRTLVIGMSGVYANTLGLEHLVRLIQSYTKAFQHSDLFAATAVKVLREKGIVDSRSVVPLVTDQPAARIGIAV